MGNYRSVVLQTLHYLSRPHVGLPRSLLRVPATWIGEELQSSNIWRWQLTSEQKNELRKMLEVIKKNGKRMAQLTKADCPMPTLTDALQAWRHEIIYGRGFVLVSGLPVEDWTPEESEIIFWCIGMHLGVPGAQNSNGDLLTHVLDEGESTADVTRLYKTSASISYHCDAADMVGLLCLKNAKKGGLSRIASSVTVFNEFFKRYPDDVPVLFNPVLLDARGEKGMEYIVLSPLCFDGKTLRTFYHSDYFRSVKRFPKAKKIVAQYEGVLEKYEAIANDPKIYLEMALQPGDMQFISNHSIIHARTAYEDADNIEQKRHLLRLWLSSAEKESFHIRTLRFKASLKLLKSLILSKFS